MLLPLNRCYRDIRKREKHLGHRRKSAGSFKHIPNFTSVTETILTTRELAAAKGELLLISMELALTSIIAYSLLCDSGLHVWNPFKYNILVLRNPEGLTTLGLLSE